MRMDFAGASTELFHRDDCFDDSGFWPGVGFEITDEICEIGLVSNPWAGVDFSVFDQFNGASKIVGERIARTH